MSHGHDGEFYMSGRLGHDAQTVGQTAFFLLLRVCFLGDIYI